MKYKTNRHQGLVSIVMPVYNAQDYIVQSISSVISQSYKNWELLIINDNSSDSSLSFLKTFAKKDKRIKVIQNRKKIGIARSLNKAIKLTKGEFIARMDADDIMTSSRLKKQTSFLAKNPQVVVLGSWVKTINENGNLIGKRLLPVSHKQIYNMMYYAMGVQHPTLMFNRSLIPSSFTWYKNIKFAEDLDLLFRLANFGKFANLPEYLLKYRLHKDNVSLLKIKKTFYFADKVRTKAITSYSYKPNFKAKVIRFLVKILVLIAPSKIIIKFYNLVRNNFKSFYQQ